MVNKKVTPQLRGVYGQESFLLPNFLFLNVN